MSRVLPGIEHVTIPLSMNNWTNITTVCLKIEQAGSKFAGNGVWFVDDLVVVRSQSQNDYLHENFETMRPSNWHRLSGGQLKVFVYLFQTTE